jgi:hypothetical protein
MQMQDATVDVDALNGLMAARDLILCLLWCRQIVNVAVMLDHEAAAVPSRTYVLKHEGNWLSYGRHYFAVLSLLPL